VSIEFNASVNVRVRTGEVVEQTTSVGDWLQGFWAAETATHRATTHCWTWRPLWGGSRRMSRCSEEIQLRWRWWATASVLR